MAAAEYYLNHGLFQSFDKNILNIQDSDKFFYGNFISNKNIKIYFNDSSFNWIKVYKEQLTDIAVKIYKQKNYKLDFKKYLIIFYFYFWILDDLMQVANFINPKSKKILNIGAGIGYLDLLLFEALSPKIYSLVEIEESKGQIDIDGSTNNFKEKIYPFKSLKLNLKDYPSYDFMLNTPNTLHIDSQFELVISIRSWCFLYPIETYIDYLKKVTNMKTLFIADLHHNYNDNFNLYFKTLSVIKKMANYNRLLFRLK